MKEKLNRRDFISAASFVGAGIATDLPKIISKKGNSMNSGISSDKEPGQRKNAKYPLGSSGSQLPSDIKTDDSAIFINDSDRIIWEEELEDFVPGRIFDSHIHLWSDDFLPVNHPRRNTIIFSDLKVTEAWNKLMFPGRSIDYLVLGTPFQDLDVQAHNLFVAAELKERPKSKMNLLVTPKCSTDDIRKNIIQYGFIGLKPYKLYSLTGDQNQCRIHDFLTHPQMELANELGLWVTLHLSKYHGCADEQNLKDLEEYTTHRYPRIKWILAHCARSFTYWPIQQAIDRLRQMPNIWYDTSSVSDVMAHHTLFSKEYHKRILYGSDNLFANSFHGKYVTMGRFWYQIETPEYARRNDIHTDARPILAIYEQLLSMKHAAYLAKLSREQIADIFLNNAVNAFGLNKIT